MLNSENDVPMFGPCAGKTAFTLGGAGNVLPQTVAQSRNVEFLPQVKFEDTRVICGKADVNQLVPVKYDLKNECNFFEPRAIEYQNGGALNWD